MCRWNEYEPGCLSQSRAGLSVPLMRLWLAWDVGNLNGRVALRGVLGMPVEQMRRGGK